MRFDWKKKGRIAGAAITVAFVTSSPVQVHEPIKGINPDTNARVTFRHVIPATPLAIRLERRPTNNSRFHFRHITRDGDVPAATVEKSDYGPGWDYRAVLKEDEEIILLLSAFLASVNSS